ncbi:MAG TPA: sodium-dependent transporter [Propionicimonas sp.]|nr:sodium-dependent transporter [Propionicimonas sp.]
MSQRASAPPAPKEREEWTGQIGFLLAAIGSAVGLGNIWRFPGVAYENGGGAFMIPYLVAILTAGIPILFLDYAIGHRFRGSAPLSLRRLTGTVTGEALGWFQVAVSFIIAIYYTAVIAWALSYFVFSFTIAWGDDPAGFFVGEYLQVGDPTLTGGFVPGVLIPMAVVWALVLVVLAGGIAKGVQRVNLIAMPLLVVGFLILVVRSLFLDGALDGLNALFTPHWAALTDPAVWIAAYSQVFFSLSIAFGIMITYASYRKKRSNLTSPGLVVAFANSSFELLAGIGVFAALGFLAHSQATTVGELEGLTGPILSFVTFPLIISHMPGGAFFGALFFGSLVIAGFTSQVSILQVVSSAFQDKFGWNPRQAVARIGIPMAVLSLLLFATTSGLNALDVVDNWANNIGVVASAVLMTVLVFWVLRSGEMLRGHLNAVSTIKVGRWWLWLTGLLAPIVLGYILITRIIALITDGYGGYPLWYLLTLGWGAVLAMIVFAAGFSAVRWPHNPDDFSPWPAVSDLPLKGAQR